MLQRITGATQIATSDTHGNNLGFYVKVTRTTQGCPNCSGTIDFIIVVVFGYNEL